MSELKPPKNKRQIKPRCCMTCKHCITDPLDGEAGLICERDNESLADHRAYWLICDYYSPYKNNQP